MSMREAWERAAREWIAWARKPGFDSYWRFHRDQFLQLVPPPGALTLDVGCGEGRLSRDLKARGHRVIGVDGSATLIEAAKQADPSIEAHCADAAEMPLDDDVADLVVAFLSLHDCDDLDGAMRECARVLRPGGRLVFAVVHPLNSAGNFEAGSEGDEARAPFVVRESYLEARRYTDVVEREGMRMTFSSVHRSFEMYSRALENAGFCIDAIREHRAPDDYAKGKWSRVPLFLHVRARPL